MPSLVIKPPCLAFKPEQYVYLKCYFLAFLLKQDMNNFGNLKCKILNCKILNCKNWLFKWLNCQNFAYKIPKFWCMKCLNIYLWNGPQACFILVLCFFLLIETTQEGRVALHIAFKIDGGKSPLSFSLPLD